ncbi:competence type IV pilus minor pilin ComGF [Parageobacillus thermoglucosidasius]|uniref:competence type IV pilus minor pilin ComGF n=1 Tax=Parageobacillus thermoglucosidasius TaxID=1426 RepID=UPI0001D172F0|nr:competence type IV pilus minor pilin ComGF [Parageobacillus thermoglucosidasius]AEH47241.1 putative ComG operon protein 6 [Parageobacillus thermoglucosidasius C56-YS93]
MSDSQEKGFTFLEMLLVMAIVLLITSLLPLFLDVRLLKYENVNGFHHIEWEIFVQQLKKELNESKQWKISGTTLYLEKFTGEQVSFALYQSSIRRQVNGTGNETALQFVENVTYILANRGIFLRVTSSDGKIYEAFISRLF